MKTTYFSVIKYESDEGPVIIYLKHLHRVHNVHDLLEQLAINFRLTQDDINGMSDDEKELIQPVRDGFFKGGTAFISNVVPEIGFLYAFYYRTHNPHVLEYCLNDIH